MLFRYSVLPSLFILMEGLGRLAQMPLLRAHLHPLREHLDVLMASTSPSLYVHTKYKSKFR